MRRAHWDRSRSRHAQTLTDREYQRMRDGHRSRVLRRIGGGVWAQTVQFALSPEDAVCWIIEMNPSVSRSSALASKATGFPIANRGELAVATRSMS